MGIDLADQFRLPASLDNIRVVKDQDCRQLLVFMV
jgi:hypothetical protein